MAGPPYHRMVGLGRCRPAQARHTRVGRRDTAAHTRDSGAALKYRVARVQGTPAMGYEEPLPVPLADGAAATLGASMCTAHTVAIILLRMIPTESVAAAKYLRI